MKNKILSRYLRLLIYCISFLAQRAVFAHEITVHEQITLNAYLAAQSSPGYNQFSTVITPASQAEVILTDGIRTNSPMQWMIFGSDQEDNDSGKDANGIKDWGGIRPSNHFYDPLALNGRGFSNLPLDRAWPTPIGQDSFTWATTLNCAGVNYTAWPFVTHVGLVRSALINAFGKQWSEYSTNKLAQLSAGSSMGTHKVLKSGSTS